MDVTLTHWIGFSLLILFLLGIEVRQFSHQPHAIGFKEALFKSIGWISIALLFNLWIYFAFGLSPALDFFTGYLMEKSLSVDNLFVFLLIFAHFRVPEEAKHRVLFYGVLGAIVMRAALIWGGIALVSSFQWIFILFGLFLILTGTRLAFSFSQKNEQKEERQQIYTWLKKWLPFTEDFVGNAFFIKRVKKNKTQVKKKEWVATPLFAVLISIELTDLIFALDSVPAILGITTEPFIVYTSNIFAILGLRALFFALASMIHRFHLMHYALAFILVFIGCKMTLINYIHIPTGITLLTLVTALAIAIIGSLKR